eukprot:COSAG06_NODE_456_length_15511_cov_7.299312_5_plen_79_part_00
MPIQPTRALRILHAMFRLTMIQLFRIDVFCLEIVASSIATCTVLDLQHDNGMIVYVNVVCVTRRSTCFVLVWTVGASG